MEPQDLAFIQELEGLAALVSHAPEITLEVGKSPDCNWSFNWSTQRITANSADLALRPPDFSRGLVLHEAGHALLTRLWHIVPLKLQEDKVVHVLLNVIEDCRIERWLQRRLPGSRPWIELYNNTLFKALLNASGDELHGDPGGAFLTAILCRWWYGRDPEKMPAASLDALNEAWPHIQLAIEACPPSECPNPADTRHRYACHPVQACYRGLDHGLEPTPMELEIRMAQHEMWELLWRKILPVFRRLLDDTKSSLGELAKQLQSLRDMLDQARCRGTCLTTNRSNLAGQPVAVGVSTRGGDAPGDFPLLNKHESDYHAALCRHHGAIEQITEALIRHFTAEAKLRCRGHYSSGQRLDVRQAMQYEADPRFHDRLWLRMSQPTRPDPAFVILADASASMKGERAHATFDALVMLRESCLRLGLPLSILVFNSNVYTIQDWDNAVASQVVSKLCALRNSPEGGTNMAEGLNKASRVLEELPHRQRHLWLLSDGEPNCVEDARVQLRQVKQNVSSITALGLGPDTSALRDLVPSALTNLDASQLPSLAGRLFKHMARAV